MVILIDDNHLGANNLDRVYDSTAIVAEDLRITMLAEGCRYLLKERKLISAGKGFLKGSGVIL